MKTGHVDLIYTDSGGITHDTKKERIAKTQRLGELAAKYAQADETAKAIMDSYNGAVDDPNNELVHLYEVWESLSERFGGEALARAALGITKRKRSRLGQLANDEPLKQGRHRGRHSGSLRDATKDELTEARQIAQEMITAYFDYLESASK